jgi:ATPase subunit of ABC transporter with duplicated ATPase domains
MTQASVEMTDVSVKTSTGRALFEGLNLQIGSEHVALVGRNGVGKSTLLTLLAGLTQVSSGRVKLRSTPHFVPQSDELTQPLSSGQLRKRALDAALASHAEILLLDEPTLHLDDAAVKWLRARLEEWAGCVIVASHDRRLLADMRHFFVLSESGGHYFGGSLAELEQHLEREHQAHEQRYLRNLHRLAEQEAHTARVARRKARKKRRGRCSELDRATPRIRLNQKRDQAQVNHGRLAKLRAAQLAGLRSWTQATRRALNVNLWLELPVPNLPSPSEQTVLALQGISASVGGRTLFDGLDLRLGRERIAVTGPNGAGKTTLLQIMIGKRGPEAGSARAELSKIGWIEQGARNWLLDESLRSHLLGLGIRTDDSARLLATHRFPLALADRPLKSLSPGERSRAALIALFARSPTVELLILDEPTFSLDLVGLRALTQALRLWPGGLVVASHDHAFLAELEMDRTIELAPPPRPTGT